MVDGPPKPNEIRLVATPNFQRNTTRRDPCCQAIPHDLSAPSDICLLPSHRIKVGSHIMIQFDVLLSWFLGYIAWRNSSDRWSSHHVLQIHIFIYNPFTSSTKAHVVEPFPSPPGRIFASTLNTAWSGCWVITTSALLAPYKSTWMTQSGNKQLAVSVGLFQQFYLLPFYVERYWNLKGSN